MRDANELTPHMIHTIYVNAALGPSKDKYDARAHEALYPRF